MFREVVICLMWLFFPPLFGCYVHLTAADCHGRTVRLLLPFRVAEHAKGRENCRLNGGLGGGSCSIKLGVCSYRGDQETARRSREDNKPQKQGQDLPMDLKGLSIT